MGQLGTSVTWKSYVAGIAAGVLLVYGGIVAAYAGLALLRPTSLPAPAITRLVPLDEKLRFLRRNPDLQPSILAVGSSITWRQLDGRQFVDEAGSAAAFLNGGTGYLRVHQTRDLLQFYLSHFDSVEAVLLVTGPPDFEKCSEEPAALLDHGDAAAYAFDGAPDVYFYLRYFSPQRYLRTAATLERQTQPFIGGLHHDAYGSSPMQVPASMLPGLRYGAIELDPACTAALSGLAEDVASRGLRLFIAFAPIHLEYRRKYPKVIEWLGRIAADLRSQYPPERVGVAWLVDHKAFASDDFFDAFHLQWPAAKRLSRAISDAMSLAMHSKSRLPRVRATGWSRGGLNCDPRECRVRLSLGQLRPKPTLGTHR